VLKEHRRNLRQGGGVKLNAGAGRLQVEAETALLCEVSWENPQTGETLLRYGSL